MFTNNFKTVIYSAIKEKKYPLIQNIFLNIAKESDILSLLFFKKDISNIESLIKKSKKEIILDDNVHKDERDDLNSLFKDILEFKQESEDSSDISCEDFLYFVIVHSIISDLDIILEKNKKIKAFEDEYTVNQVESMKKINSNEINKLISLAKERYQKEDSELDLQEETEDRSNIDLYTSNLNKVHKKKAFQKVIGRTEEMKLLIRSLSRKNKNNPIVIGDSGVGKTALIEGLAASIVDLGDKSDLFEKEILSLDITALTAGSKYRGEFEDRFKKLIGEISSSNKYILFIDDIHTIMSQSNGGGTQFNLAGMLKPYILRGELKVIGTSSFNDYSSVIDKDQSFSRLFSKIKIEKPTEEQAIKIIKGIKESYETFHKVKYSEESIEASVILSERYIHDKFLPDKAIDLIDEAGAFASESNIEIVDEHMIEALVSSKVGIRTNSISFKEKDILLNLKSNLKKEVFGQDKAIELISDVLLVSSSGLNDENQPNGVFLFLGSTGVGKTELSKKLAKETNMELIRLDMSEYADKTSISKLVGTSAGYVGYGEGGKLTNAVRDNPHSIILLDELEKADITVFNLLLQILDNGFLSDGSGRNIDFRNTTIIMTSNAGLNEENSTSLGFHSLTDSTNYSVNIEKYFPIEFLNRIDEIINFNYIDEKIAKKIIEYKLNLLAMKLKEKKIKLSYLPVVIEYMIENGFNKKMGARPLDRIINKDIKTLIAKKILLEDIKNNTEIVIMVENNKIKIKTK